MKPLFTYLLLIPFLFASCKRHDYIPLTHDYLSACQSRLDLCNPIEIVRKHPSFKYIAYFKSSYKVTSIMLMDSTYSHPNLEPGAHTYVVQSVRSYQINPNTEFNLDLTGLPDGKYFVDIYGSKTGYIFPITLVSR